jgi:KDO2-lipid IV(A) lauroyltransferase
MRSSLTKETLDRVMEFRGLDSLNAALAKGKGAILCTGHIRGLFTFFFGLHLLGYKVNAVRRQVPGFAGPITNWFTRRNTLVDHEACNFLWMHDGVNLRLGVHAAAALSRNEILIMLIDARQIAASARINFLDRSMSLPSGHVVLAQATGAPLLNFFIYRPTNWFPQIADIGEMYLAPIKIEDGVQHCISVLEKDIRRHPSDWTWFTARDVGPRF